MIIIVGLMRNIEEKSGTFILVVGLKKSVKSLKPLGAKRATVIRDERNL